MKTLSVRAAFLVALLSLVLAACNEDNGTVQPGAGEAVVEGTVTDALTDLPVADVTVSAAGQSTLTTAAGVYTLKFTVDSITTLTVSFGKSGYRDTLLIVQVRSNEVRTVPMRLSSARTVVGGTGIAQTIAFRGASPEEVSVYGVGGTETSLLAWEVRDSLGQPIDGDHAVDLSFSVVNGPGGGEYVSPAVVRTGLSGQAYTTLNAGTRSGVTQILASASVGGRTIASSPVRVIINGGFPVQSHFSIAATNYNFPGLDWMGRTLAVSILAGDVYSNPVAPNTAVYFSSSAGVVQPSVFTDDNGQGTVNLISGNPRPFGVYAAASPLDTSYHYLVAHTVGQGGVTVSDSIFVLWSGRTMISSVAPTNFAIPNGGSQIFTFSVSDRYFHPLSPGTEISISASVPPPPDPNTPMNQIQLGFGVGGKVTLDDYLFRGPGSTDFSFRVSDGSTNVNQATSVTITISVASRNGDAYFTFSGTAN